MASVDRRWTWGLAGLTLLAALLQASRLPFRWNGITVAYASYFKEYLHTVQVDGPLAALTTFVGLHPPGYSLLFGGMLALGASPLIWMATSGALSVASVPVIFGAARTGWGRAGPAALAAAAVLAVSPHRNAYGLEINNYPLLIFATALQLWAWGAWATREEPSRRPSRLDLAYGAATALALYSHVLAIVLPASQLAALLLQEGGRARLRRFMAVQAVAAIPCLTLLPAIAGGASGPPMNEPAGLLGALKAAAYGFPTRYGAAAGAAGVAIGLAAGVLRIVREEVGLVPRSWLLHAAGGLGFILWMVTTGVAADHQYPYYLAIVPSGALLVGAAFAPRAPRPLLDQVSTAAVVLGLLLHVGALGLAWGGAAQQWGRADVDRGLVAMGVEAWSPGSVLVLVQFPQWTDDDKDSVDVAWAHIPMGERVRFESPGVDRLVPGDPYAGQPILVGDRWLYTFTQWSDEWMEPIVRHHVDRGERVVIALTETEFSHGEVARAEAWAATWPGLLGRRATDQVLWIVEPTP